MSTHIVVQCLVVLTFALFVLTNYHALFVRPHQFLPVCVPEWLQWLWISVSGHSCPAPCRELGAPGFSGTEATRTVGPMRGQCKCFKTENSNFHLSTLAQATEIKEFRGISLKLFYCSAWCRKINGWKDWIISTHVEIWHSKIGHSCFLLAWVLICFYFHHPGLFTN